MMSPAPHTPAASGLSRLVVHEDDDLLVVRKPAGWNTHAPAPYANEGIYDWLRHREPRWATLAILHRLDKETSGLLVFGKTALANRSLTAQFTERAVDKSYVLLTDRRPPAARFDVRSRIARHGDRYASGQHGEEAETRFESVREVQVPGPGGRSQTLFLVRAEPLTGRTHQIRVHASDRGMPILGDVLYGGSPAARLFLHAGELSFRHPSTSQPVTWRSPAPWEESASPLSDDRALLEPAFVEPEATDCHRVLQGGSHGRPGWFVDRLGSALLSQSEEALDEAQQAWLREAAETAGIRSVYHKKLIRRIRGTAPASVSPELVLGEPASDPLVARENGAAFELSFQEGYSVGLFLDQRDNRRRWKTGHVAAGFRLPSAAPGGAPPRLLNTFAYTCGFSVVAALGGWHTTSLDLSKKYLEWGRRNFARNGLAAESHDFIFGDTFDWLRRFQKKGRLFEGIVLDPPTFSESKEGGRFQAEKDFGSLVRAALGVLAPGGVVLASTNAARLEPAEFVEEAAAAVRAAGRRILHQHYVPQPPDFPISRAEPGYLKTLWISVG